MRELHEQNGQQVQFQQPYAKTQNTNRSDVTTPLNSESLSGISEFDYDQIHVPRIGNNVNDPIDNTNWKSRIHRMPFKREEELAEINFGIEFS